MTIVRFCMYTVGALLTPFVVILLGITYCVLHVILLTWHTWLRAKGDPRYDEYWWVS